MQVCVLECVLQGIYKKNIFTRKQSSKKLTMLSHRSRLNWLNDITSKIPFPAIFVLKMSSFTSVVYIQVHFRVDFIMEARISLALVAQYFDMYK